MDKVTPDTIRNILRKQPMKAGKISRTLGVCDGCVRNVLASMSDLAEEDDGTIFLIEPLDKNK